MLLCCTVYIVAVVWGYLFLLVPGINETRTCMAAGASLLGPFASAVRLHDKRPPGFVPAPFDGVSPSGEA